MNSLLKKTCITGAKEKKICKQATVYSNEMNRHSSSKEASLVPYK